MKKCDKKEVNSLPITGVHNKLKNSIVFCFLHSFFTFLSFLRYSNSLGCSRSILVSFSPPPPRQTCMPLDAILLGMLWSSVYSFSLRYHDFDVKLYGCRARGLPHRARYLECVCVSCRNRYLCALNPSLARLTRYKN